MSYPSHGISFRFNKGVLHTIFLYPEGDEGYAQFRGRLPDGVSFLDRRSDILAKLGSPERTGSNWDRFDLGTYLLHFHYRPDDTFPLITVMSPLVKQKAEQSKD